MNKNGMADVGSATRAVDEKLDSLKDTMKGLADQGAQKVDALRTKVISAKNQALDRGGALLERATALIQAHPLKAVGIAFVVGYLGTRLLRR